MPQVAIQCPHCGSGEYRPVDSQTGEMLCLHCRGKWMLADGNVPTKAPKRDISKPRVIRSETPATERHLMEQASGFKANDAPLLVIKESESEKLEDESEAESESAAESLSSLSTMHLVLIAAAVLVVVVLITLGIMRLVIDNIPSI